MSDFKAKMHEIRFPLDPPQTPLEELTALPTALAVFERSTSKRREREKRGKRKRRNGRRGGGRDLTHPKILA